MKKALLLLGLLIIGLPSFSEQIYEMKNGEQYMFFSNDVIKSIKSDNASIISAQKVYTYMDSGNQIVFQTKGLGKANIQIETNKDKKVYSVIIKKDTTAKNDVFIELDIPEDIK